MSNSTDILKDKSRLIDLVRHQRAELHDAGLITSEEYVALAQVGSESARRLEEYDDLLASNVALREELDAMAEGTKVRMNAICRRCGEVFREHRASDNACPEYADGGPTFASGERFTFRTPAKAFATLKLDHDALKGWWESNPNLMARKWQDAEQRCDRLKAALAEKVEAAWRDGWINATLRAPYQEEWQNMETQDAEWKRYAARKGIGGKA